MSTAALQRSAWLSRAGQASFAFFFVKGLAWLASPLILYWLV